VVVLEDLAAKFNLRSQDAIDRVQGLEKTGRITGVTDDRGKFIYIEPVEMEKVREMEEEEQEGLAMSGGLLCFCV